MRVQHIDHQTGPSCTDETPIEVGHRWTPSCTDETHRIDLSQFTGIS